MFLIMWKEKTTPVEEVVVVFIAIIFRGQADNPSAPAYSQYARPLIE